MTYKIPARMVWHDQGRSGPIVTLDLTADTAMIMIESGRVEETMVRGLKSRGAVHDLIGTLETAIDIARAYQGDKLVITEKPDVPF